MNQKCHACGAGIVFLPTTAGRRMPVNEETVLPEDAEFDPARHTSHFATCSEPDKFRQRKYRKGLNEQ